MKRNGFILPLIPIILAIGTVSIHAQNTVQDRITTLLPDHRIIFRLSAPQADSVSVLFGSGDPASPAPVTPMTKDANGLWSVTLGPFPPDLYEYQFNVDGVIVADPGNNLPIILCVGTLADTRLPVFLKEDIRPSSRGWFTPNTSLR